ncbi:hypothetical protein PV379_43790, partial [Streptomyces caniscabiei]|nr:hypothetical protein [Streptomyces caniscabiei]
MAVGMTGRRDGTQDHSAAQVDLLPVGHGLDLGAGGEGVVGRVVAGRLSPVQTEARLVARRDPPRGLGAGQHPKSRQPFGERGGSARVVGVTVGEQQTAGVGAGGTHGAHDALGGPAGAGVHEHAVPGAPHQVDMTVQAIAEIESVRPAGDERDMVGQPHDGPPAFDADRDDETLPR